MQRVLPGLQIRNNCRENETSKVKQTQIWEQNNIYANNRNEFQEEKEGLQLENP